MSHKTQGFQTKLSNYKSAIDADIAKYAKHVRTTTLQQYGANARLEIDAFLNILERGGKRIRGSLVMLGYEMSGGTNTDMILQAARAVEMLHAYILIIDDIQDRSRVRRGGPTAHHSLAEYHRENNLAGEPEHFGLSIALNGALAGAHAAQMTLSFLDVDPDIKLAVISIMNRTMLVTAHGQTNDIMHEVVAKVSQEDIERVLEWKTAHYTFLNPLHVGMVLAGADCHATDAITPFAIHAGKAFQIADDLLGTFGTEVENGKSPMDDIRQGKRTLLVVHALQYAKRTDKNFLLRMLGNTTITPAQFERCKIILAESGAVAFMRAEAKRHIDAAFAALDKEAHRWPTSSVDFLRNVVTYLLSRVT